MDFVAKSRELDLIEKSHELDLIEKSREFGLNDLVEKAKDWALTNALTRRFDPKHPDNVQFCTFALLPSTFPRKDYEECVELQPLVNKLYHRVAQDKRFLLESLERCRRVDEFTNHLLELLNDTGTQGVSLGLLRSDYMLAERWGFGTTRSKQVEVNTIASGHGWLGKTCAELHRYILKEMDLTEHTSKLPKNSPIDGLCSGMYEAWKLYDNPRAVIMILVDDFIALYSEIRNFEYLLHQMDSRIRVIRRNLTQLTQQARLEGSKRVLFVEGHEVALVYMRCGYSPEHYHTQGEWRAREMIEQSYAIKCPNIAYHLAGCKKIQQVLSRPGVLERFLTRAESSKMRRFFTGMYSLDLLPYCENNPVLEAAERQPENYVLKPQREGGYNNYFGYDILKKLAEIKSSDERDSWILMDKIVAVTQKNYLVRPNSEKLYKYDNQKVTSELGIFGVILADRDQIIMNEAAGHTLRTKPSDCNEVGMFKGRGALDSPFLI